MSYIQGGPYGVLLTPFDPNGNIQFDALGNQIDKLAQSKLTGIVVGGTTSEFIQMTAEENIEIMKFAVQSANGGLSVVAGACGSNIKIVETLAQGAKDAGVKAILVCPPYYTPLSPKDIEQFYITLARNLEINIILYNLPAFTSKITIDILKTLIHIPNIIGMKDSSGNLKEIISYVNLAKRERHDFAIFTGTDQIILPALVGGCIGSMTALSGILPKLNTAIYDAFEAKDVAKAMELQQNTIALLNTAESILFPAGYKIIAKKTGYITGEARQVISTAGIQRYIETEKDIENELKRMDII